MRPVNLLPEEHRPRRAGGSLSGSAYAMVGVLAVLLGMVTLYVFTSNQASARQADAAQAKNDTARAQAQISRLGPFGNFTQIKEVRVASVKGLAQARFDWERFVRELALVLPRDTWLTEVEASATGDPAAPASPGASTGPSAKLKGCAPRQPGVATLMVRLRKMNRVKDVELKESAQQAASAGGSASATAPAGGATAPASGGDCTGRYQFDMVVQFDEAGPAASAGGPRKVPASLGGGG